MSPQTELNWDSIGSLSNDCPSSIVYAGEGHEGSGKSAFALSMPDPIFVCAFDPYGMNRVDEKFKKRADGTPKNIKICRYNFNPNLYETQDQVKKAAKAVWDKFVKEYRLSLSHVRSVIWDREDMASKLMRYSVLGDTSGKPSEYEDLYIDYAALITEAFEKGINLALLRGMKEKWVSKFDPGKQKMVGHNTGEYVPSGMKNVPDLVDIVLRHRWDETMPSPTEAVPDKKGAYVVKFSKFTNPDYRGQEVANLDFPLMAMTAYPNSDPEWWM